MARGSTELYPNSRLCPTSWERLVENTMLSMMCSDPSAYASSCGSADFQKLDENYVARKGRRIGTKGKVGTMPACAATISRVSETHAAQFTGVSGIVRTILSRY